MRPGITGLWQVTARSDPSFETNMVLDLEYIESWSLEMDCKILLRTLPTVLRSSHSSGSQHVLVQPTAAKPRPLCLSSII